MEDEQQAQEGGIDLQHLGAGGQEQQPDAQEGRPARAMPGATGVRQVGHRQGGRHEHGEVDSQGHLVMAAQAEDERRRETRHQGHGEGPAAAAARGQGARQQGDEGRGRQAQGGGVEVVFHGPGAEGELQGAQPGQQQSHAQAPAVPQDQLGGKGRDAATRQQAEDEAQLGAHPALLDGPAEEEDGAEEEDRGADARDPHHR